MSETLITASELVRLEQAHRECFDRRMADRIKAVILLGKGWSPSAVAEALLMDPGTVREHLRRYRQGGLETLLHMAYRGSEAYLDEARLGELAEELDDQL